MKSAFILFVLLTALFFKQSTSKAQSPSAAESVDKIKMQLIEITAKEEMAKLRVQQLDEALKPENIERVLAGVGSTRPEDVREQRKRQLTIERTSMQSQTELLAMQRTRLEAALVTAEANAYLASAKGTPSIENAISLSISSRWLILMSVTGLLAIVAATAAVLKLRALERKMT